MILIFILLIFKGHLTSFALLLGGNNGGGNGCDSSDFNYTLTWISFGFVLLAIIIVLLSLIFIELYYRKQRMEVSSMISTVEGKVANMR